jgi:hypothetical protein
VVGCGHARRSGRVGAVSDWPTTKQEFKESWIIPTGQETSNNRRKTKSLHWPQLDHHDADGLAGHKTWRTAQTITRTFNILKCLYMRPLFYGEFADFTILYLQFIIFTFNW